MGMSQQGLDKIYPLLLDLRLHDTFLISALPLQPPSLHSWISTDTCNQRSFHQQPGRVPPKTRPAITLLLQRVLILPNRSVLNSSLALVMLFMNKVEGKMVVAPYSFTFPHRESIYYAVCLAVG